jgi:endonuclease YncB( thermonuclease family)
MQILRVLTLVAITAAAHRQGVSRPEVVQVRAVIDGQTIDAAGYGRVRLAGITAPRPPRGAAGGEPFGRDARDRLDSIVGHRFVRLELASPASRSAYVLLEDGTCVNTLLVAEGLARVSGHPRGARGEALARAEERAREGRRGIWSGR